MTTTFEAMFGHPPRTPRENLTARAVPVLLELLHKQSAGTLTPVWQPPSWREKLAATARAGHLAWRHFSRPLRFWRFLNYLENQGLRTDDVAFNHLRVHLHKLLAGHKLVVFGATAGHNLYVVSIPRRKDWMNPFRPAQQDLTIFFCRQPDARLSIVVRRVFYRHGADASPRRQTHVIAT